MIKNILGVVAGFIVGGILFTVFQIVSHGLAEVPVGIDWNNMSEVNEFFRALPVSSFLIVAAGYAIGSLVGGMIVGYFSSTNEKLWPLILGILFTVGWTLNIISLPHPVWMIVLVYVLMIPCVLAGHRLAAGKAAA